MSGNQAQNGFFLDCRLARQELGIRSVIPAIIGRQSAQGPSGYYRRLMRRRFQGGPDKNHYGQRWQAAGCRMLQCSGLSLGSVISQYCTLR